MEELTIEEKAKAYDFSLKRAKRLYEQGTITESLSYVFPQLKRFGDEEVMKEIIAFIKKRDRSGCDYDYDRWIAWLEKQKDCEHIKKDWFEHLKQSWYKEGFIDGKYSGGTSKEWTINDTTTLKELIDFLENGTAKLQHDLTQYAKWLKIQFAPNEKQGEQKSDNKFETKFKAGDWIVFNGLTLYIKEVVKGFYRTISIDDIPNSYDWDIDNVARLWTIQDAKDGDVLAFDNDIVVIFKDFYDAHTFHSYCFIQDRVFDTNEGSVPAWWKAEHFYPATKEQRDTLFKAMADAGYTFDFEKKELKKISQRMISAEAKEAMYGKPAAWSGEDNTYYDDICEILINLIHSETAKVNKDVVQKDLDWLISIKNRVIPQPMQEWNKEDEKMYRRLYNLIYFTPYCDSRKKLSDWLKSIKQKIVTK